MFRIARVRIRRINTDQRHSTVVWTVVWTTQPAQVTESGVLSRQWMFSPQNWRVRVKWVGFGSMDSAIYEEPSSPVLGTFDLPKLRVRLRWVGLSAMNRINVWAWALFILVLGIFAFTRLPSGNNVDRVFEAERVKVAGLITDEVSLNDETIQMTHSSLDMGQSKDIFDQDIETLIRGLEANPLVLDFQFPNPRPITGLVMDFGGMDFDLRVEVYNAEDSQPTLYTSEYRNQPPIPHVEINFANGPALVTRINIEIEQFNPPDETHIHVREVLFKE
jgi:hypothetical protein